MKLMVVKEFTFDSAHWLPGYPGMCKNTHGHTYRLRIGVSGEVNPKTGMVCDFVKLKNIVQENIISKIDHQCLNECHFNGFPFEMPTAENMIMWIVNLFQMKGDPVLEMAQLWETPTSYCEWRKISVSPMEIKYTGSSCTKITRS
jgi:6-pyruvoyltetrahydropterin/6-carboxytetrahydropterin synthase